MQYVNDDMDELFRKAAKDYPLNTNSADWEKVKKALDDAAAGKTPASQKTNRRHFLWLLLLLPLPWICMRYTGEGGNGPADALTGKESTALPAEGNTPAAATTKKNSQAVQHNVPNTTTTVQDNVSDATITSLPSLAFSEDIKGKKANRTINTSNLGRPNSIRQQQTPEGVLESQENERSRNSSVAPERPLNESQPSTALAEKKTDAVAPVKDSVQRDSTATAVTPAKKEQKPEKTKGFYTGAIGGVDITSVKLQEVKDVGYDLGFVVGYSFNRKWSVEAGLISSEKAYYSSGEHMAKAYLLPGTTLKEAEGDCRMWEVPLVVRYNFNAGKKGGWFASAGSSSYFMKEESYDYTYSYTATGQEIKRSYSYPSNSNHLFAAAQLSGGYNRRIGKTLDLRIEPYMKLPLRKVGYYELPLTSFGVHAGITKKLY